MKNRKLEEMPDPAKVRTDLRDLREVLRTDRESMQLADHVRDHYISAISDALVLLDGDNQSLVDDAESLTDPATGEVLQNG